MPGFDPSQARDKEGQWSGGGGGSGGSAGKASGGIGGKAREAVNWVKSGEAARAVGSVVTEDRIKTAASVAIQGIVNHVAMFSDPIADEFIEQTVHNYSMAAKIGAATAYHSATAAIGKMVEMRRAQVNARTRRG